MSAPSEEIVRQKKRLKWEPAAAMIAVLVVGIALVLAPGTGSFEQIRRPGSTLHDFQAVHTRGRVEIVVDQATQTPTFRVLTREGHVSPVMDAETFKDTFGEKALRDAVSTQQNWAFRLFKITSWASLVWVAIGFGGQIAFSGRMLVQWFVSEKQRQSTVPEAFWWMSLIGGMMLFAYFAWRQELVGVIGQTSGLVIYARNIRLIYKQRRRERRNGGTA